MKESDEILRSNSGYHSVVAFIILYNQKNIHQGVKLHIIFFSLTDINMMAVIILFPIHLLSEHKPKSLPNETFVVFVIASFNFTMLLHE